METEEKEWFTPAEAAEYLGIDRERLAHLRRRGRIKGEVRSRITMYHISALKNANTVDLRTLRGSVPVPQQTENKQGENAKKAA